MDGAMAIYVSLAQTPEPGRRKNTLGSIVFRFDISMKSICIRRSLFKGGFYSEMHDFAAVSSSTAAARNTHIDLAALRSAPLDPELSNGFAACVFSHQNTAIGIFHFSGEPLHVLFPGNARAGKRRGPHLGVIGPLEQKSAVLFSRWPQVYSFLATQCRNDSSRPFAIDKFARSSGQRLPQFLRLKQLLQFTAQSLDGDILRTAYVNRTLEPVEFAGHRGLVFCHVNE